MYFGQLYSTHCLSKYIGTICKYYWYWNPNSILPSWIFSNCTIVLIIMWLCNSHLHFANAGVVSYSTISIHAGNCQKKQMRGLIVSQVCLWSTIGSTRNDPHLCTDETESLQSHRMCHCEWNLRDWEFPTWHVNLSNFGRVIWMFIVSKTSKVIPIIWTLLPIYITMYYQIDVRTIISYMIFQLTILEFWGSCRHWV